MFYQDSQQIYRVSPLEAFPWLVHGFGTRWSKTFGSCGNLATLHQIHSDIVVDAAGRSGALGDGDALISNTPGTLVAVKTADCVPILIVDPAHRAVAAVHAGWRGSAHKIVERAVEEMVKKFSTQPTELHVAIGPSIGQCCYEVGPEVATEFGLGTLTHAVHIDLSDINRLQAIGLGVPPEQIYTAGLCTKCSQDFHSFRRDKQAAGRMLSVVGIR